MYVSPTIPILLGLILVLVIISFISFSNQVKYWFISLILSFILLIYLVFINLDHPVKTNIIEEKVFIINNKAITENTTKINTIFNKNFKDGDVVYRVEYLPYWHRFAYWFYDNNDYDYEYFLKDPRAKNENN